jgi:TetR/AcrR family transcriptional regulator
MSVKDSKTEHLIKETAERMFLKEGKMLATTQDIADAAGVNRTLLHYYFRSRDVLFNLVFKEALTKLRTRVYEVLGSEVPFRAMVENLVNVFYEELSISPYLETFIALQLNQEPGKYEEFFTKIPGGKEKLKNFLKEVQLEIDNGNIHPMKPINFFINLFALMAYPFVARPIYTNMFDLSDAAYEKLLCERKKVIISMLFKQ